MVELEPSVTFSLNATEVCVLLYKIRKLENEMPMILAKSTPISINLVYFITRTQILNKYNEHKQFSKIYSKMIYEVHSSQYSQSQTTHMLYVTLTDDRLYVGYPAMQVTFNIQFYVIFQLTCIGGILVRFISETIKCLTFLMLALHSVNVFRCITAFFFWLKFL